MLSDGSSAIIEAIEVEKLAVPQTTYNFEVADFHTYYVTQTKVLVHNSCRVDSVNEETLRGEGRITSKFNLTLDEALEAGQKFLGDIYTEIGKAGSGVFKSGNRIFRIDANTLKVCID